MNDSSYPPDVSFDFPLPRPHCGIALGNGTLGIWVWGGEFLCLTIARAGFWKHRDDEFTDNATFEKVRALLEADDKKADDESGLRALLANLPADAATPPYPTGDAHLELRFEDDARPVCGTLKADGSLEIELTNGRVVRIESSMDEEVAWLQGAEDAQLILRPAWEWGAAELEKLGFEAPLEIGIEDGLGFIQTLPDDDALALVVRQREGHLFIATALGEVEEAAKAAVTRARRKPDINPIYYWKQFWRAAPRVRWPDAELQRLWNSALFEQARLAAGNAATDRTGATSFIAALTELLVQNRRDGIHVLTPISRGWGELSFDGIRCEGAFIIGAFTVGASVEGGRVVEVRVESEKGGHLRLYPGQSKVVEREMSAGEAWVWRAIS